jgi:hypothetical protein
MTLEDLAKMDLPMALGIGVLALVAARFVPELRPPLKAAIRLGLDLVEESHSEAEAGIIDSLVTRTVDALVPSLLAPPGTRGQERTDNVLRRFRHRARVHARRWARDPAHVDRHYRRHVRHLRDRLEREWRRRPGGDPRRYERILSALDGDLSG